MKLNIDRIFDFNYVLFNCNNKSLLYFLITNYFKLKIINIEDIGLLNKFILFNKLNKSNYVINISRNTNLINKLNPKLIIIDENIFINDNKNSFINFKDFILEESISEFLSNLFKIKFFNKNKINTYNLYQILSSNNFNLIKKLINIDVNLYSNFKLINIFYDNKYNKYLRLKI